MIDTIREEGILYYSLTDLKQILGIKNNKRMKQEVEAGTSREIINRNKMNYADLDGIKALIYKAKYKKTAADAQVAINIETAMGFFVAE